MSQPCNAGGFENLDLGFVLDFGFRDSDFRRQIERMIPLASYNA
jgi:hypothetical protein